MIVHGRIMDCFRRFDPGQLLDERQSRRVNLMSFTDKVRNEAEELSGKTKQAVGRATDNESLVAKGEAQETGAQARKAAEHVKDAGKDVKDAFQ